MRLVIVKHVTILVQNKETKAKSTALCTSQCKSPHPPGRDTAGHYWGISCDLTKKTSAHIGVFYIFCSAYIHRGKGPELFPLTEKGPEMSLAHILGYSTAG
jgi:hypothetical protein